LIRKKSCCLPVHPHRGTGLEAALCARVAAELHRLALRSEKPTVLRARKIGEQRLDGNGRSRAVLERDIERYLFDLDRLVMIPRRLKCRKDEGRPRLAVVVTDDADKGVLDRKEDQHGNEEPADE
jgi:hypothetical protein